MFSEIEPYVYLPFPCHQELLPGLSEDSTTCSRRGPSLVSTRAVVGAIPGALGRRPCFHLDLTYLTIWNEDVIGIPCFSGYSSMRLIGEWYACLSDALLDGLYSHRLRFLPVLGDGAIDPTRHCTRNGVADSHFCYTRFYPSHLSNYRL
jgi:hypothetical protein